MFSIEQMMMQLSARVADDLHLIFLPAEHRFLDQHFGGRRGVEAALDDLEEFRAVVGDAAAGAAEREGGADDGRQADLVERLRGDRHGVAHIALLAVAFAEVPVVLQRVERLVEVGRSGGLQLGALGLVLLAVLILDVGGVGQHRLRGFEPDRAIASRKSARSSALSMACALGADHLDIVAVEHAHALQRQRGVERRLAAHGRQQRVRPLLGDDLGDDFRRDRLDIGGVGQARIGHDRRRIGVDQDDPVALLLQRLAGLGAGIVELASLADDDRSRADDEDRFDVWAFWHVLSSVRRGCTRNRTGRPGRAQGFFIRLGGPYRGRPDAAKPQKESQSLPWGDWEYSRTCNVGESGETGEDEHLPRTGGDQPSPPVSPLSPTLQARVRREISSLALKEATFSNPSDAANS